MALSEGSALMVAVLGGHPQAEVARRAGVTRQAVSAWAAGQKRPAGPARAILDEAYAIPPASWDRPPGGATAQAASAQPPQPATTSAPTAYERALAHVADVDATYAAAKASGATYTELARLFSCRSGALAALARCQPTWTTILDSPEWADILTRLRACLAPHRAAAEAVAQEFEGFRSR